MPLESDMAPNLDLKSSLTLRVVAVALFCFLIAAALALLGTYRDVRQLNEHVADVLVRQLQMRLSRIETSRDANIVASVMCEYRLLAQATSK